MNINSLIRHIEKPAVFFNSDFTIKAVSVALRLLLSEISELKDYDGVAAKIQLPSIFDIQILADKGEAEVDGWCVYFMESGYLLVANCSPLKDAVPGYQARLDQLKWAEKQQQNMLAQLPGIAYWKDKNSVYRGCNQRFVEISNLHSRAEVCGRVDHDFHWGVNQADSFRQDDQWVMNQQQVLSVEHAMPIYRDDGKQLIVLSVKTPLIDQHTGKVYGVFGVAIDITDQKSAQGDAEHNQHAVAAMIKQNLERPLSSIMASANQLLCAERVNKNRRIELAKIIMQEGCSLKDTLRNMLVSLAAKQSGNKVSMQDFILWLEENYGEDLALQLTEELESELYLDKTCFDAVTQQFERYLEAAPSGSRNKMSVSIDVLAD